MSDYQMIIHTDANSAIGHAIVELRGPNGARRFVGFNPEDGAAFNAATLRGVRGKVKDEVKRMDEHSRDILSSPSIAMSKEGYDRANRLADDADAGRNGWNVYDGNDRNCIDFADAMVKAGGAEGDIDDHLSSAQRQQMTGAMTYNKWKYGQDRPPMTADERQAARHGGLRPDVTTGIATEDITARFANPLKMPDHFPKLSHPVLDKLAEGRRMAAAGELPAMGTPPTPGFGLAEALNGKPFEHVAATNGGDIPLGRADLLHKDHVRALMGSQTYSDAKHPLYKPATETVKDWFAQAYPGSMRYDETGTI